MSSNRNAGGGVSVVTVTLQVFLVGVIALLWNTPLLQPVKLLVVLLHEMSHGLMALATGGSVDNIIITPSEGGACHTTGGNALLIVSAGYLGSMFFGGLILSASRYKGSGTALFSLFSFLLIGAAFSVLRDDYSRHFALAVAAVAVFMAICLPGFLANFVLRVVGTISCLYAMFDIYNDILSEPAQEAMLASDAYAFAEITGVPPVVVGMGWLVICGFYFLIVLRSSLGEDYSEAAPQKSSKQTASA